MRLGANVGRGAPAGAAGTRAAATRWWWVQRGRRKLAGSGHGSGRHRTPPRRAERQPRPLPAADGRAFRRSLNQTGRYTRKPSNDPSSLQLMEEHGVGYSSTGLVAQMRERGNVWQQVRTVRVSGGSGWEGWEGGRYNTGKGLCSEGTGEQPWQLAGQRDA